MDGDAADPNLLPKSVVNYPIKGGLALHLSPGSQKGGRASLLTPVTDVPCPAELLVAEEVRKPADLLEPENLVSVHAEVLGDPGVRFAEPVQSGDEIAHEINIMRSPRPVVPYRGKLYILIRIMYVL